MDNIQSKLIAYPKDRQLRYYPKDRIDGVKSKLVVRTVPLLKKVILFSCSIRRIAG